MIRRFVRFVMDAIKDPERDFYERVFIIFSLISELAVMIALVGDLYIGENLGEIITLIAIIIVVPLATFISLYKKRISLAIGFLVTSLVFLILPALVFFGGGLEGGGVIWIVFGFMYVGLAISGVWRRVFLVLLFIMAAICYLLAYYHPELVQGHSREMAFVDSFISLILVGLVCFFMTWSQNRLFRDENERAKKAAEKAEELTRAQNRFFSSMSHEIRTPINSILGLNELILRDQNVSDEIVKDASGIQGAGKLLLALINDILDFSKMEAGSMAIVPVDYRIGDTISEIVNMIWLKANDKGLKFDVTIDPKVPAVLYGDEVRIKQIMINLLNNAVKYTQEGSIGLHIESANTDENTTVLSISVSDTGMGIKKEAIPYLFDAFKRVDEAKNRNIEGTGLGLSIVKQLTELMNGNIAVNSVYGEGSTFTVTVTQGITDPAQIGDLNIHNQTLLKRKQYESSFLAPEAKVLIVDDNEMNIEVEKRLLLDTKMVIDTALSGKEALELTVQNRYDVILMDHLMPEMDGIECLKNLRDQAGGLNRVTPVVVLTANAGSENRDMYNRAGFDGYLVKPVSGEALEEILMRHISRDKLRITGKIMRMREDISTTAGYTRKSSVIITSTSMCDLPDNIINKLNIPIIPFLIRTDEGVFKDGVQMDANELTRYISSGRTATSSPPDVWTYTEFFANALKKTHNLIHISLTSSMSDDYAIASEAAKSFGNVTVINSGCITSATGILVLIAYRLAQQNIPADEIVDELNEIKDRLRCSFIIDTTEYMAKKGLISQNIHNIVRGLSLHPSLKIKDDKSGIGGVWAGSTRRAYSRYIKKAFPVDIIPDSDVVFITYADVPMETLLWIREEVSKIAYFEHVVFQQASAAISSNCGPGSFGILYFVKSNKSYNIGSFIEDAEEKEDDDAEEREEGAAGAGAVSGKTSEGSEITSESKDGDESSGKVKWYQNIKGIDGDIAIENSGSEDAFKNVLRLFYDSIDQKSSELEKFFSEGDWENYTIKVHALKSSAKLVGAMGLSDKAMQLEMAGKEGNSQFILNNHFACIREFVGYKEILEKAVYTEEGKNQDKEITKPMADEFLMGSVYDELRSAADAMDCEMIGDILKELEEYEIPADEKEKYDAICNKAREYDYNGIIELLTKEG